MPQIYESYLVLRVRGLGFRVQGLGFRGLVGMAEWVLVTIMGVIGGLLTTLNPKPYYMGPGPPKNRELLKASGEGLRAIP